MSDQRNRRSRDGVCMVYSMAGWDGDEFFIDCSDPDGPVRVRSLADASCFDSREALMEAAESCGLAVRADDGKRYLNSRLSVFEQDLAKRTPAWTHEYDPLARYDYTVAGPVRVTTRRERNERLFREWNAWYPSRRRGKDGGFMPLAATTQQVMRSHLNHMKKHLRAMGCDEDLINGVDDSAFAYSTAAEMQKVVDRIFADVMFQRNSRPVNRNYLRAGLLRYLQFLQERDARHTQASPAR